MKPNHTDRTIREIIQGICRIFFWAAIINFAIFVIITLIIGGDAVNGKEVAGHYFLGNHGQLTEVNYLAFVYSKIHVLSVWVTMPLGMIAALIFYAAGGEREDL